MCHDGLSRPATQVVPCEVNTIRCPPGQYLAIDPQTQLPLCLNASIGEYSIGGAIQYNDFETMPADILGDWTAMGTYMSSGNGDSSSELAFTILDTSSSVSFWYKVYQSGTEAPSDGFFVSFDGIVVLPLTKSTDFEYKHFEISDLGIGPHVLRFNFLGGTVATANSRIKGAQVKNIQILGAFFAALHPIPCPSGTVSSTPGATECTICPANTYSTGDIAECAPCPDASNHYSFPGSGVCFVKDICEETDFAWQCDPCQMAGDNSLSRLCSHVALLPQICRVDPDEEYFHPQLFKTPSSCPECPPGTHRQRGSALCTGCPMGSYYSAGLDMCSPATVGYFTIPIFSYFVDESWNSQWPENFETKCSGDCGSGGWRLRGTEGIDSGIHPEPQFDR